MKIFSEFPTINIKTFFLHFWLVLFIAKNFILTTLKLIFTVFRFFCTLSLILSYHNKPYINGKLIYFDVEHLWLVLWSRVTHMHLSLIRLYPGYGRFCGSGHGGGWRLSFDWHLEEGSGLWNVAFLAKGAEIMVLFSEKRPPSPLSVPQSEGIWLCGYSVKRVWCGQCIQQSARKTRDVLPLYVFRSVDHLKSWL